MNVWQLNLQLRAWQEGRAIPAVGRQRVQIDPQAWICCPLAMAGEDPSLHAVLLGPRGAAPQLLAAPDPRSPRSRLELFSRLRRVIEPWIEQQLAGEDQLPQLILPSASAAEVLLGLADYLPYLPEPKDGGRQLRGWTEDARALGRLIALYAARQSLPGQQLLLVASSVLDEHFAFGQELRGHLGAQLCWIDPPENEPVALAAAKAERQPMGAKTDAEFDRQQLAPALEDWAKVERGGSRSLTSFRRQQIEDLLRSVLAPIFAATEAALAAVEALELPVLDGLEQLWERDRYAFERHVAYVREGGKLARSDNTRRATYGLAESEDALEQWQAALLWDDPLRLAQARVNGDVLSGVCSLLPDFPDQLVVLHSKQRWLRVRLGDELCWMEDPKLSVIVEDLVRAGDETRVLLRLNGKLHPQNGQELDFASEPPNWFRLAGERRKISRSLEELPTTHRPPEDDDPRPEAPVWQGGEDPLQLIEALR